METLEFLFAWFDSMRAFCQRICVCVYVCLYVQSSKINFLISVQPSSDFSWKKQTQRKKANLDSGFFFHICSWFMVRSVNQVQTTEKNKQPTKQPNDISICRLANVALMKLNLLLSVCTLGLRVGLFFSSSPSFTVKCSCMLRYHGILYLLWCRRGTRGARIWRICWLQAGVYSLHTTMSRASEALRQFWWEGNSKNLVFF